MEHEGAKTAKSTKRERLLLGSRLGELVFALRALVAFSGFGGAGGSSAGVKRAEAIRHLGVRCWGQGRFACQNPTPDTRHLRSYL